MKISYDLNHNIEKRPEYQEKNWEGLMAHVEHECKDPSPLHKPEIPRWQRAKSYFKGSSGSNVLSDSVISCAAFQSVEALFVKPKHLEIFAMCVSRGIISLDGSMLFQMPR
jgi:hypothetical protein